MSRLVNRGQRVNLCGNSNLHVSGVRVPGILDLRIGCMKAYMIPGPGWNIWHRRLVRIHN